MTFPREAGGIPEESVAASGYSEAFTEMLGEYMEGLGAVIE
ncbi:MAG: hypothetical protein SFU99_19275 [Saprospiraceae bacterium]|nr:hypothetical protein [Saprospiraceae bacterium]